MWEGNKSQAAALESVLLGGGKRILQRHAMRQLEKVIKNVSCVVMSVRVSVMCCGSVQHIVTVELTSC